VCIRLAFLDGGYLSEEIEGVRADFRRMQNSNDRQALRKSELQWAFYTGTERSGEEGGTPPRPWECEKNIFGRAEGSAMHGGSHLKSQHLGV
jgi:hypothetical protein